MARRRVRKKRRRPVAAVLLALVVLAAGLGVIGWELRTHGRSQHTSAGAQPAATASVDPSELLVEESSSPPPTGVQTRFADGIWVVGKQVKAGRYKTTVPADVFACHWERMRGNDGTSASTIEEGLGKPGSKVTITIRSTDKLFKSELCGMWAPA
jgi:hypothetical protein